MIAGYIINRFKEPPKVSVTFNIFMWFVSMMILTLCVFGIWKGTLDQIETAFWVSLGHSGKTFWVYFLLLQFLSQNFPSISLGIRINLDHLIVQMGTGQTGQQFPVISRFFAIKSSDLLYLFDSSNHASCNLIPNGRNIAHKTFHGVYDIFGKCGDIVCVCVRCVSNVWSARCANIASCI